MYRCKICKSKVPERQPMLRHVLMRTVTPTTTTTRKVIGVVNGQQTVRTETVELPTGPPHQEVASEVPVCGDCSRLLGILMTKGGHSPAEALRELWHAQHVETPDWSEPPEPARVARPAAVMFAAIPQPTAKPAPVQVVKFGGA
jgi:hypothetical protein